MVQGGRSESNFRVVYRIERDPIATCCSNNFTMTVCSNPHCPHVPHTHTRQQLAIWKEYQAGMNSIGQVLTFNPQSRAVIPWTWWASSLHPFYSTTHVPYYLL